MDPKPEQEKSAVAEPIADSSTSGPEDLLAVHPVAGNAGTPSLDESLAPSTAAAEPASVDPAAEGTPAGAPAEPKPFDPIQALKLGSQRLANIIKRGEPKQQQADTAEHAAEDAATEQPHGSSEVVARWKATAAGLGARAKEQGSRFYQASIKTAASTAEGIKRLALGEPVQALCRNEVAVRPCPQLVLACCTALVSGGGITTERIFKHNPPQELVDRLAATAAGPLSLLPPGASPHAVAALLKQFLLGLPEPLLTYRLLPQWVAAGDHPDKVCRALVQTLPPANANVLRLLMQTCHYMNEQAALNEMDSQALAEVLAGCVAWKPPPKQQLSSAGLGPGWQGLSKALSLKPGAAVPAAAVADAAAAAAAAAGAAAEPAAAAAAAGEGEGPGGVAGRVDSAVGGSLADVHRLSLLDDAEQEAVVTVLEYMISNFNSVFGV